jgi:lysophospholipase L1-like esterase
MKNLSFLLLSLLFASAAVAQTKSVSILGDSYSTYEGFMTPSTNELWYYGKNGDNKTDVKNVRQTWWHEVISENGWRLCINNSYSGATVSYTGYDGNDYSARSFNTRMDNLGQPDIIFVFGATNDSWAGTPIGEYKYDNITYGDLYQFRPALARMLQWMTDRYINTEIYFLLNNDLREEIDESVKTICARYNVPVIELENIDKLSGHPSVKGMRQIADQVNSFIKKQHKISSRSH